MANADVVARDARGEWQPDDLPRPGALFRWPLEPSAILKYIFGWGGLLWPFNVLFVGIATVSWLFLTPSMERMSTLNLDWIALIYLRNACILTLFAGGLHLHLYTKKRQGTKYKYSDKWLAKEDKKFLFKNQVWDNIFWSLAGGCVVWTGYEVLSMWAYANNFLPFVVDWSNRPVYCVLLMIGMLLYRQFHFYWIHRFTHWKPLYKTVHYLHHKNINIGPWSGIAMHPIEHILFFSGVLLYWIIPAHPLHALAHLMHAGLNPARGHTGFYKVVKNDQTSEKERALTSGSYFHYLHHRFFTVNFGGEGVPLDKWFGSFHDGTPGAQKAMVARREAKAKR